MAEMIYVDEVWANELVKENRELTNQIRELIKANEVLVNLQEQIKVTEE